jgi:uncharacterized protein (TIGR03435 family)
MSDKIYTRLLRLYPSSFRKKYEGEALQLIRDRFRDERGFFKRARLWWDLVADVLGGLPSAYRNSYGVTEAASLSLNAAGIPSFKIPDQEPLGLGSILAGGTLSLIALAVFGWLLSHPMAHQTLPDPSGRMSPIESVMQRLNSPPAPDSTASSPQDAATPASAQMSEPQAQPSTPGASTPDTSASSSETNIRPMVANANPRFAVATIRPSKAADTPGKMPAEVASISQSKPPMPNFALHHGGLAQSAESTAQNIADTWQGTLHAGRDLRIVFKISKADGGGYKAVSYSIDQGGDGIPVNKITLEGTTLKMTLTAIGGAYEGKLSADGKTITGTWSQGPSPLPLTLVRATPETEWTIPPPTPRLPPMVANASPGIEVATIKPTKPDEQGFMLVFRGGRFQTTNISLSKLLAFSYGVQQKQLIGLPPWADTDKYDIDAKPDTDGAPNKKQLQGMVQKLIADRFKLTFHHDQKELAVYALSVAKTGAKLTKSENQEGLPGFGLGGPGALRVRNATMSDFAAMMQETVMDRPVLNQTELAGRYDFTLNWTPDDSQFGGMPARTPPPTDNANPPPALYTAIEEQIGLKLDATKAPTEVMVIDHVEKPSEN